MTTRIMTTATTIIMIVQAEWQQGTLGTLRIAKRGRMVVAEEVELIPATTILKTTRPMQIPIMAMQINMKSRLRRQPSSRVR